MLNSTVNLYVSVVQALRRGSEESRGYRKTQHTYMISVEPHYIHIPGLPRHEAAVTHFEAIRDVTTGNYGIAKYTSKNPPGIIGSILIAKSAHTSLDKVHNILLDRLKAATSEDEAYGGEEDEHRTRTFIHALQGLDLVAKFKVEEFMMWTHSYLMDRLSDQAPALVSYPRVHSDKEQKTNRRSFSWSKRSIPEKTRTNSS